MNAWDSPLGYKYATASAGFRENGRRDLALALSERPAATAALFTSNRFNAAPVRVARGLLAAGGRFRAVLFNAGQANAGTGGQGEEDCRETLRLAAAAAGLNPEEILPASTGIIGDRLNLSLWERTMPALAADLGKSSPEDFAGAIMTTDRFPKIARAEVRLAGGVARLCGMAKGAGMICPNMATMLALLLCDAEVEEDLWKRLTAEAVRLSFNRVSVDGDTSTNDTLYALANGASGVRARADEASVLQESMTEILSRLAYMLVEDGEGATKVIHVRVSGAPSDADAEKAARSIGNSQLVKTAMYGQDANWGRIIAALGRSGAEFLPEEARLAFGGLEVFRNGMSCMSEDDPALAESLKGRDIFLDLSLGGGRGSYTLLASDLTHKYIDINAEYRS
ncbi:MAG: bifunctional glutamate N-acetyltransferase/amino-acid acetyltransferase ArgJ [Deltaproteobacteria bacterium]|nr:bifunctional glutamate N-acetyltransferase/amino-acid acetyltransferase ArgJ [Deltaproteobacteria bacterium]